MMRLENAVIVHPLSMYTLSSRPHNNMSVILRADVVLSPGHMAALLHYSIITASRASREPGPHRHARTTLSIHSDQTMTPDIRGVMPASPLGSDRDIRRAAEARQRALPVTPRPGTHTRSATTGK
jgi:hypothetical protein